jgi:hypothetical protein
MNFIESHKKPKNVYEEIHDSWAMNVHQYKNTCPALLKKKINRTDFLAKYFPTDPNRVTGKFYKIFQEEIVSKLHKLFQNIGEESKLPTNSVKSIIS